MSISPTLAQLQQAGFPIGGEPSIALDLVDTVANAHTTPSDLLAANTEAWWELQSGRLPESPPPTSAATGSLRNALRDAFEASIDGRLGESRSIGGRLGTDESIAELNRVAGSAWSTPKLDVENGIVSSREQWQTNRGANPRLATIARDAIALLADPVLRNQLRRCANPTCSMLFLATNPRRVWCASNVCGNRARVARHQQRQGHAES
jgi:predicted RNA-binding Zn ribbon-like protein